MEETLVNICNSCVKADVCKYVKDLENLKNKIIKIDEVIRFNDIFTLNIKCSKYQYYLSKTKLSSY
jgi:hypothetical protein